MASKGAKPAEGAPSSNTGQELAKVDVKTGGALAEYAEMMSGQSDFGQADLSIPFIRIIQGLSPQIQPQDPKYIEEAKQGQIIETVTPKLYGGNSGLIVVPVLYQRSYTEWKPNRGGMVADHGTDSSVLTNARRVLDNEGRTKYLTAEGNEIAEGAQYYVFYAEVDNSDEFKIGSSFEQAMLVMSGTQWKVSRDWNTNMQRVRLKTESGSIISNPLPFAKSYILTTVAQKKDNYNFFGWKITPHEFTLALPNGEEFIRKCSEFRKLAMAGHVRGDEGEQGADPVEKEPF